MSTHLEEWEEYLKSVKEWIAAWDVSDEETDTTFGTLMQHVKREVPLLEAYIVTLGREEK